MEVAGEEGRCEEGFLEFDLNIEVVQPFKATTFRF